MNSGKRTELEVISSMLKRLGYNFRYIEVKNDDRYKYHFENGVESVVDCEDGPWYYGSRFYFDEGGELISICGRP